MLCKFINTYFYNTFLINYRKWGNTLCNPAFSSNNTIIPYNSIPPQNDRSYINNYIIFNSWMPFFISQAFLYFYRSKCHPLINFYMISYTATRSNNNPTSMINYQILSDTGFGINFNTCFT